MSTQITLDLEEYSRLIKGQLTEGEKEVLNLLAASWNLFLKLPTQHPMHAQEFCGAIHDAQRLVMSRPTSRSQGWANAWLPHVVASESGEEGDNGISTS